MGDFPQVGRNGLMECFQTEDEGQNEEEGELTWPDAAMSNLRQIRLASSVG